MRTHTALVTLVATLAITAAEDITVTTTKGRLRGERADADMGQYYYAFKGVPYAKSPTKDLRFQVWTIYSSFLLKFKMMMGNSLQIKEILYSRDYLAISFIMDIHWNFSFMPTNFWTNY